MEFEIRHLRSSGYVEVVISEHRTRIELGLLDKEERAALAKELRDAADEIDPPEEQQ